VSDEIKSGEDAPLVAHPFTEAPSFPNSREPWPRR
jgi:hypothetical protein